MEGAEAGSGRNHSGRRGGGHERAASSLRNRRGEHGVPCASYVKRATGTAANGRAALAGRAPRYANKEARRPMEGAGGGQGARGHVFHYVTAASQRQRRRRGLRAALSGCGNRRGVGGQTRRTHQRTDEGGRGSPVSARRGTHPRLRRRRPPGRPACRLRNCPGRPGLQAGGSGSRRAGSGRRRRALQPTEARPQSFLGHLTPSQLETSLGMGAVIPILQIKKLRFREVRQLDYGHSATQGLHRTVLV